MRFFFFFFFVVFFIAASAQKSTIDSLKRVVSRYETFSKIKQDTVYVNTLNKLSVAYLGVSPDSIDKYAKKAQQAATQIGYEEGRGEAIRIIALVYYSKGDIDKGSVFLSQALSIQQKANNKKKEYLIYSNMGTFHLAKGEYAQALTLYKKNLAFNNSIQDYAASASVMLNMGNIYIGQGNTPLALETFQQCLRLAKQSNNAKTAGAAMISIANIYDMTHETQKALAMYRKTITMKDSLQDMEGVVNSLIGLSLAYIDIDSFSASLKALERALALSEKIGSTHSITLSMSNTALVYFYLKNYKQSIIYYQKAQKYAQLSNNNVILISSLLGLSKNYAALRKPAMAISHALDAYALAKKLNKRDKIVDVTRELSYLYEQHNEGLKALSYYKEYVLYKDSLYNKQNDKKIAQLQAQYEYEQKEAALNIAHEKAQYRQQIMLGAAGIGIIMLLFVLLLTLKNRRNIQAAYRKLSAANAEIATQSVHLQQLNATKDKLFSIIGHDLRGPIASLKGLLDLLASGLLPIDKFQKTLPAVQKNVENVQSTLDSLLQWSHTQMRGMTHTSVPIDAQSIAENTVGLFTEIANRKNIVMQQDIAAQTNIVADKDQISLIIRNLLNNALKFTPSNGSVRLSAQRQGAFWAIAVADSGIGMTAQQIENLFHTDTHSSTVGTNGEKGTGLGLLLCKEMVELNGGTISVTSEVGVGSTFTVCMPAFDGKIS